MKIGGLNRMTCSFIRFTSKATAHLFRASQGCVGRRRSARRRATSSFKPFELAS